MCLTSVLTAELSILWWLVAEVEGERARLGVVVAVVPEVFSRTLGERCFNCLPKHIRL